MNSLPQLPPRSRSIIEVDRPNLGVYLDRPPNQIPERGLSGCKNVRVRDGRITNENVGYELFVSGLGNQVLMVEDFIKSDGSSTTIFGTKEDLFRYDTGTSTAVYITPRYTTGTVSVTNGSAVVTGSGTTWLANLSEGDKFHSGSSSQDTTSATWYTILTVDSDTQITLTANYAESTLSGEPYTARQLFTATDLDYWDADVFPDAPLGTTSGIAAGDRFMATNGSEIIAWDGSSSTVVVIATATTGLAFTCKRLSYFKNMMLFGNLLESGTSKPANFKNSAIGDPENVTTAEANEFTMAEGVDFIEAMVPLGDYIVGYAGNSINIAQFIGTPAIFSIRTAHPGIGVFSGRTIVDFGNFHEFLGNDGAYRFDGVRLESYGDHVFPEVLRRADRNRASKAVASISEEELEVYWVIPLATDGSDSTKSAEFAYTEHYKENVGKNPVPFMFRDLPATAMGFFVDSPVGRFSDFAGDGFDDISFRFNDRFFTSNFPVVLFGDESGRVFKMNTQTGNSTSIVFSSFVQLPEFTLVDGESKGIIRKVEPFLEKNETAGDLWATAQTTNRHGGDAVESELLTFDIDHSGDQFKPSRIPGRYGTAQFFSISSSDSWRLNGYKLTIDRAGGR